MSQEGLIEVQGKEIVILDLERLRSLADGETRM
jgi:CRP/FNR family transcriptional regulator